MSKKYVYYMYVIIMYIIASSTNMTNWSQIIKNNITKRQI